MFTVKIYDDETDILEDIEEFITFNEAWNYAQMNTNEETQYYTIRSNHD
jgi:hypothetical protein